VNEDWSEQLPPASTDEQSMLEFTAIPRHKNSRLSCQIQLTQALDGLSVELPTTQY
jgi:2Fe-2S ferredoxin